MENSKRNKQIIVKYLLYFAVFAIAGYFREYFFVQINNILYSKYYHRTSEIPIGPAMQAFTKLNYETLYYAKYPFTLLWSLLFFVINYLALKHLAASRQPQWALALLYLLMFVLTAFAMLFSYLLYGKWENDEYTLSRWLMGIAQSPLPALLLLAGSTLQNTLAPKEAEHSAKD